MTHTWDPDSYLAFADDRGRPFVDLVGRIDAAAPRVVVDLGCGPGNLTALLKQRWPEAEVRGVDSSPEMVAAAQEVPGVTFEVGDLRDWEPAAPVEVLVSNATLQWLPDHLDLLPGLVEKVAPEGWLAFQVPGNFEEPSHAVRREIAQRAEFASYLDGVASPEAYGPEVYLESLAGLGCRVDAWETTYLHVLQGENPVYDWVVGTGARPTLQALPAPERERFSALFRARLAEAYLRRPFGTVLPFRRVFVVAQKVR